MHCPDIMIKKTGEKHERRVKNETHWTTQPSQGKERYIPPGMKRRNPGTKKMALETPVENVKDTLSKPTVKDYQQPRIQTSSLICDNTPHIH